jgi:hypothetical protein
MAGSYAPFGRRFFLSRQQSLSDISVRVLASPIAMPGDVPEVVKTAVVG